MKYSTAANIASCSTLDGELKRFFDVAPENTYVYFTVRNSLISIFNSIHYLKYKCAVCGETFGTNCGGYSNVNLLKTDGKVKIVCDNEIENATRFKDKQQKQLTLF